MPDIFKRQSFNFSHTRSPILKPWIFTAMIILKFMCLRTVYITYYIEEHTYNLVPGDIFLVIPPNHMRRPVVSKDEGMYERFVMNIPRETLQAFSTHRNLIFAKCFQNQQGAAYAGRAKAKCLLLLPPPKQARLMRRDFMFRKIPPRL